MRLLIIFTIIFLFSRCAKKHSEEVDEAVDVALTHLTYGRCDDAIEVLEDVTKGRDLTNPIYLQVLSSAYACRAQFDEISFVADELTKIRVDSGSIMTSLTTLSFSEEKEADSPEYLDLRESINILLNVDSFEPSQTNRTNKYGPRKAGDMGVQAIFLIMAQLGKFLHFYGNVDQTGAKGKGAPNVDEQGAQASNCFITYTDSRAVAFLSVVNGECNNMASDRGHPNLSLAAANLNQTKRRLCEGLMLITNLIDILTNIQLPDHSSFGELGRVKDPLLTIRSTAIGSFPVLATLLDTTSQSVCETLVADSNQFNNLQLLYALIFEVGLP